MTGLLDTNVALPLPLGEYGLSVITEMELLAWPSLTPQEETKVRMFLKTVLLCEMTPAIRREAVRLRREERLKLPAAIICATAVEHQVELWTNDQRLFDVPRLRCRSVGLQTPTSP